MSNFDKFRFYIVIISLSILVPAGILQNIYGPYIGINFYLLILIPWGLMAISAMSVAWSHTFGSQRTQE